jgi:hypothetical protein
VFNPIIWGARFENISAPIQVFGGLFCLQQITCIVYNDGVIYIIVDVHNQYVMRLVERMIMEYGALP